MKKKKILIVIQLLRRGGVEMAALNFALNLDRNKYDITFFLQNPYANQDQDLVDEVKSKGIRILERPKNVKSYIGNYIYMKKIISQGKYDIVHSHVMFFSAIVVLAAKKYKVKVRATHSHAVKWNRKENLLFKIYRSVMRFIINHCATDKIACSYDAGCYLYGEKEYKKNGKFISNGIKTSKYEFNVNERNSKRQELKISDDEILVGHIGTLYYIKNQTFLIEIFAKMLETNPKMKLVLVGEDVDGDVVRKKTVELGIQNEVIFLGIRNDIPQLLFAMDIFIFPSLFEALPVSLIEAQATKLPCLISDTVTSDVKFNDNVEFLSITDDSSEKWAEKAFELVSRERNSVSTQKLKDVYDISSSVKELDKIYSS